MLVVLDAEPGEKPGRTGLALLKAMPFQKDRLADIAPGAAG
jgi:hypothetical protein